MKLFILFAMIFCHIVDDYYLQGILANLKQKQWWRDNGPKKFAEFFPYIEKCGHDYIAALIMHSMSWAFMILLPIALYQSFNIGIVYVVVFVANATIHALTDNAKANKRIINLIQDQTIHIVQIALTYMGWLMVGAY